MGARVGHVFGGYNQSYVWKNLSLWDPANKKRAMKTELYASSIINMKLFNKTSCLETMKLLQEVIYCVNFLLQQTFFFVYLFISSGIPFGKRDKVIVKALA